MAHILIFDSGIGGLSVSEHIRKLCQNARLTYVADDAFRPYGNKTEAQLNARLPELLGTLDITCAPDVIVIACNTASTTALPGIRAAVRAPVVGVVPAIKPAAQESKTGVIAVLGTPGTVARDYVGALIDTFAVGKKVILQGSTALVEQAERKLSGQGVEADVIAAEVAPIFSGPNGSKVDHVVLACTHFPLLIDELSVAAPSGVKWIDSGAAIARRVASLLKENYAVNDDKGENLALLIGPEASQARTSAFADFGYPKVIALEPLPLDHRANAPVPNCVKDTGQ